METPTIPSEVVQQATVQEAAKETAKPAQAEQAQQAPPQAESVREEVQQDPDQILEEIAQGDVSSMGGAEESVEQPAQEQPGGAQAEAQQRAERTERFRALPPRERIAKVVGAIKERIVENIDAIPEDKRQLAEQAVDYNGKPFGREASDGIKALLGTLDVMADNGDGVAPEFSALMKPYIRVVHGEGENRRYYTPEEWNQRLAQEQDPQQRAQLEQEGIFAFDFAEQQSQTQQGEQQTNPASENIQPNPNENTISVENAVENALASQVSVVREVAGRLKSEGGDVRGYERIITLIQIAQAAHGEGAVLAQQRALSALRGSNIRGLDVGAISVALLTIDPEIESTDAKLEAFLDSRGLPASQLEFIKGIKDKEGIDGLIASGIADKIKGFDVFIFGKPMSKEDLDKMFDADLKGLGEMDNMLKVLLLYLGASIVSTSFSTAKGAIK